MTNLHAMFHILSKLIADASPLSKWAMLRVSANSNYASDSSQCLVNLALMRHSLMAVEFEEGELG